MGEYDYSSDEVEAKRALLSRSCKCSQCAFSDVHQLILAARATGATAERARLAGLASEEDREMVERVIHVAYNDGLCDAKQYARKFYQAERLGEALLARLAAARGEAVEEAIRWAWANHERFHVDSEDEAVRDALAALLPRGPDAATGTGEGMDRANIAEAALRLMAEGGPQESFQCNYIAREILAELTHLRTALAAAERAGAERALRLYWKTMPSHGDPDAWVAAWMATLFPPPGAEVGRG